MRESVWKVRVVEVLPACAWVGRPADNHQQRGNDEEWTIYAVVPCDRMPGVCEGVRSLRRADSHTSVRIGSE